jgi:hypothetical protein
MQMPIALFLALLASSQAFGQDASDNSATNKAVTFAELEGSIVDAKIERQQYSARWLYLSGPSSEYFENNHRLGRQVRRDLAHGQRHTARRTPGQDAVGLIDD